MDVLIGNWTVADWAKVQNLQAAIGPTYGVNLIRGITLESLVIG
jgi:hypothetical protein